MNDSSLHSARRRCLRVLAPVVGGACLGPLGLAWAQALSATASSAVPSSERVTRVLRFTFSRRREDPRTQWLIAVYRELLASLGWGFEFVDVPPGRGPLSVQSGEADGELGRTWGYGQLYPDLVRVSEPNNAVEFAAYATTSAVGDRFPTWLMIRERGWRCEHRRGIQELAALLGREAAPQHVSTVATIEQGLRRLQLQRTDLYFDVREAVDDFLAFGDASAELVAGIKPRLLGVVQSTTGHAYLHRRHEALVPAISQALREMKRQGLVARLREDALKQFLAARLR